MPITVDLNIGGGVFDTTTQIVSLRESWSDDWTAEDYLHCTEAEWSIAPAVSFASFHWDYGSIKRIDGSTYQDEAKKSELGRQFVKVAFTFDQGARNWYGVIEQDEDYHQGTDGTRATGRQGFIAYGLEKLLLDHTIKTTYYLDPRTNGVEVANIGIPFNNRSRPNRSAEKSGKNGTCYVFEACEENATWWSTADIIEYLLVYQTPLNEAGDLIIPFSLAGRDNLPAWDQPEVRQHLTNTYSIIDELASRTRGICWQANGGDNGVEIEINTLTAQAIAIDLPGALPIPANNTTIELRASQTNLSQVAIRRSDIPVYDQVIMQGEQRRVVGTVAVGAGVEKGWSSANEAAYYNAATGSAAWAAADANDDVATKQKLNAEVRASAELRKVYSYFQIPKDWDGKGAAEVGAATLIGKMLFGEFIRDQLVIEQSMPLFEGVDYSGDRIIDGSVDADEVASTRIERAPFLVFQKPWTAYPDDKWVPGDEIAAFPVEAEDDGDNQFFSAYVDVPDNSRGIYVIVSGQPQHVIAGTDFTRQPEDEYLGDWTYLNTKMLITLSLLDHDFAEGRWPLNPAPRDVVRVKVIYAPGYRDDYVASDAVVDIDDEGDLVRTNGGTLPARDPTDVERLTALAKIASAWYETRHRILSVLTRRITNEIDIGKLITHYEQDGNPHREEINAIVSSITVRSPLGSPGSAEPPEMEIRTWAGELDAVQTVPMPVR